MNVTKNQLIARGVPYEEVMERFLDDEAFYYDYLHEFTRDKHFQLLQKALAEGQAAEAFHAAHTLKGLMSNLGLLSLVEAVSPLVEVLRQGSLEGTEALFSSFQSVHQEYCGFIEENIPRR